MAFHTLFAMGLNVVHMVCFYGKINSSLVKEMFILPVASSL